MNTYTKLISYALVAGIASLSMVSCFDDKDPEIKAGGPEITRAQKAHLTSLSINLGEGRTIKCDVYDYDNTIDLSYTTDDVEALKSATATCTLSDGARISPDPAKPLDYTVPIEFTVTSEDGSGVRKYKTVPFEKVLTYYTKVSEVISRKVAQLGIDEASAYHLIGCSGKNIVINDKVFDGKTLAPVGTLDQTGLDYPLAWLTNDSAGHLVASTAPEGNMEKSPSSYWVWKDGWDKAPVRFLHSDTGAIAGFLQVGGDVTKGSALAVALGARGAAGAYFLFLLTDGERSGYVAFTSGVPTNDGSWSQMASPCTGELGGRWFLWDSVSGGGNGYTFNGIPEGKTTPDRLVELSGVVGTGPKGWGNHQYGSCFAFNFNDTDYGAFLTHGWPATYLTVEDGEGNYLITPGEATFSYPAGSYRSVGAYNYVEADKCGYLYAFVPGGEVKVWKLEKVAE